mmetsp:Transcript_92958/g.299162  ORF Transcript_92958/g.299162 Transcript_92958/m.299162 type:complete len:213 (-) Transcript_92958:744-1382(-)
MARGARGDDDGVACGLRLDPRRSGTAPRVRGCCCWARRTHGRGRGLRQQHVGRRDVEGPRRRPAVAPRRRALAHRRFARAARRRRARAVRGGGLPKVGGCWPRARRRRCRVRQRHPGCVAAARGLAGDAPRHGAALAAALRHFRVRVLLHRGPRLVAETGSLRAWATVGAARRAGYEPRRGGPARGAYGRVLRSQCHPGLGQRGRAHEAETR